MALKIYTKFEGEMTVLSKMAEKQRFILESKMVELNQNKNSKQPDQPDAV